MQKGCEEVKLSSFDEINELHSNQNKRNSLLSSGKSMTEIQKTHADDTQVSHSSPDQNLLSVKTENTPDNFQDVDGLDDRKRDNTVQRDEERTAVSTPKKELHGHNPYNSEEEDSVISMQNQSALGKKESLAIQVHAGEPQVLQFEQIPKTPSKKTDKALEDGYNWRKYGQKLVKGNEFVRSYYRCTFPNCSMKRQVERSHVGPITDIVYLGQHHHPKPQESSQLSICSVLPIQQKKADEPSLASGNDNEVIDAKGPTSHTEQIEIPIASSNSATEGRVSQSCKTSHEDGDQKVKKQKKDAGNTNEAPLDKSNGESKIIVQAQSEVDMVNDGYRWRKYGQKMVKGNTNPRSYYRCTNVCCPVKKHVERDSADHKTVITTYEGQHNHEIPPGRIVSPNSAGSSANRASSSVNDPPRPKENKSSLDIVVHISAST
ncbi:WRKY transcription factor 1-like [Impatiens glandulifera]|uniref:WRKY transcription factor 1-like n=1 Tax=Impatiens glandulifera TaxID=253017 RepID=UPI001FB11FE6|nr:WRKY transcription factor 1-like [Impatiens glandulifera]